MKRVIPDADTAFRIGLVETATSPGAELTVFQYEQHRTGLTLFGVEVTSHAAGNHLKKIIVTQ